MGTTVPSVRGQKERKGKQVFYYLKTSGINHRSLLRKQDTVILIKLRPGIR